MKRISFILLIFVTTISFSQNNLDEVVYLKNGSVIRGLIIEQIPNQTLKIQTKDGSVFVYNFSEVQKITKEGLQNLGKAIEIMAENEELNAHKNAVSIRLKG